MRVSYSLIFIIFYLKKIKKNNKTFLSNRNVFFSVFLSIETSPYYKKREKQKFFSKTNWQLLWHTHTHTNPIKESRNNLWQWSTHCKNNLFIKFFFQNPILRVPSRGVDEKYMEKTLFFFLTFVSQLSTKFF